MKNGFVPFEERLCMEMLKNEKFRRTLIMAVLVCAAGDIIITVYCSLYGALVSMISEAVCIFLFIRYTLTRLHDIAELSDEMDRVLHGKPELSIDNSKEGELYILSSELQKMTVRLRAQAEISDKGKKNMSKALADISHQLRTPLTAMNLTVNLLADDVNSDADRRKHIHELKDSLSRMQNLVEALLKIAKLDSGTVEFRKDSLKVRDVIGQAVAPLLIPMELKDITPDLSVGEASFTGDMEWSIEAFGNLIKNSLEHTPPGGVITVRAQETPVFTEITISDTGEGFAKQDLPHLFERFYRGENATPRSVGIGLSLSRDIIKAENGTIKADNISPHGARFTVKFYKHIL